MHSTVYAVALAAIAFLPRFAHAQAADAKTAEQVYKNIVQLKGVPSDQVQPAMQFIAGSLGVDCAFCHVDGKPEADDKGPKKTAREMMAMVASINKDSFRGQRQVTCYSCHRGAARPQNTPPVLDSDAPATSAAARPAQPAAAPSAADIIDKYVAAMGGADAIRKITSRVQKGVVIANSSETPIDVITKAPNLRLSVSHSANSDSLTGFDGAAGWMGSTGRNARSMTAAESAASSLDAEFYLGLRLKEMFPQLRVGRPEDVAGSPCYVLTASAPGKPPVRLFFDQKSGLLVRMVRYADTPMGRNATQIDYTDFRDVDGVKTPFRWTLSRPVARFSIQIKEVQTNVTVDAAKFAKPDGPIK